MFAGSKWLLRPSFFPLHFMHFQVSRQDQSEFLEQDCLVFGGLRDTASADIDAALGGQDYVHHLYLRDLIEHFPGILTQASSMAHLPQRLPYDKRQEANQDVSLHPLFPLMPYRADRQITLGYTKRSLSLSESNVSSPEFLGAPILDVAPK